MSTLAERRGTEETSAEEKYSVFGFTLDQDFVDMGKISAAYILQKELEKRYDDNASYDKRTDEPDSGTRYAKVDDGVAEAGVPATKANPIDDFINAVPWNKVLIGSFVLLGAAVSLKAAGYK